MLEHGMDRAQQLRGQADARLLDELAPRAMKPASVDVTETRWPAVPPSSSRSVTLQSATSRRRRETAGAWHSLPHATAHSTDRPDRCRAGQASQRLADQTRWRGISSPHPDEYSRPGGRGATGPGAPAGLPSEGWISRGSGPTLAVPSST